MRLFGDLRCKWTLRKGAVLLGLLELCFCQITVQKYPVTPYTMVTGSVIVYLVLNFIFGLGIFVAYMYAILKVNINSLVGFIENAFLTILDLQRILQIVFLIYRINVAFCCYQV